MVKNVKIDDNFGFHNPQLVSEWSAKNQESVFEVLKGTAKKYLWVCSICSCEFETSPNARHGREPGCQACKRIIVWKQRREKLLASGNTLKALFPNIAQEVDTTKHPDLDIGALLPGTQKALWWKCRSCLHEWQSTINNRTSQAQSGKCPACSRRDQDRKREEAARRKRGSLADKYPEIAIEFHPEKNGSLTAEHVSFTHTKKLWWRCTTCAGDYLASPYRRTKEQTGCRKCSFAAMGQRYQKKAASKGGSFRQHFPHLAEEWHPTKNGLLDPETLSKSSNKSVFWQCKFGHVWQATINRRTSRGANCPECFVSGTSRIEIRIFSEVKYLFPDAEWRKKLHGLEVDIYIPSLRIAIEYDGKVWHADKNASDERKNASLEGKGITLYRVREDGLPRISERDVVRFVSDSDLLVVGKLLAKIASDAVVDDESNIKLSTYLNDPRFRNEALYHEVVARLPAPAPAESLAALRPDLALEWHPTRNGSLLPEHFAPRAGYRPWWLCSSCGHEFQQTIDHRNGRNAGCPRCGTAKAWTTRRSNQASAVNLASARPDLLAFYDDNRNTIPATHLSPKSSTKVHWACASCGRHWVSSPKMMQMRKYACRCHQNL